MNTTIRRCGHQVPLSVLVCPECGEVGRTGALRPPPRRRWGRLVVGLIVVLALAGGAAFVVSRSGDEPVAEGPAPSTAPAEAVPVVDADSGLSWSMQSQPVRRSREGIIDVSSALVVDFTAYVAPGEAAQQRVVVYSADTVEANDLETLALWSNGRPYTEVGDPRPVTVAGHDGTARLMSRTEAFGEAAVLADVWSAVLPNGTAIVASVIANDEGQGESLSASDLVATIEPTG